MTLLVRPRVRAALTAMTLLGMAIPAAAMAADALDGTWELSLPRSGPHRQIQETVTIAHEGEEEVYSAKVVFKGEVSGARYRAKPDGKPYPLLDLKTGQQVGAVVLQPKKQGVHLVTLSFADPKREAINIEHWATQGGDNLISLLKNDRGEVMSVLVFERQ